MPARDDYFGVQDDITAPINNGVAITPNDSNDLPNMTRALWVGGAGNISVVLASGSIVTLSGVPAGTLLPLRVARVRSTSTTATLVIGLW